MQLWRWWHSHFFLLEFLQCWGDKHHWGGREESYHVSQMSHKFSELFTFFLDTVINVECVTQFSLAKNFTLTRSYASLPRVITRMAFLSKYSETAVIILFCKCRKWGTEVKWTTLCGKSAFISLPQTSNSESMLTSWSKWMHCLSECRMCAHPWMSSHTFTKLLWC